MEAPWFEETEQDVSAALEAANPSNANLKLERRRRIEELYEERRLREEMGEF